MIRHPVTLFLTGLGALGVCLFLVLLLPPVQRALVLAAFRSSEVSRVEIERVRIRPGSLLIEGLLLEKPGVRLTFDRARVRGALWKGILRGRIQLAEYRLQGLSVVIEADGVDGIAERLAEAGLVLAPFAFELDRVDLDGGVEVRLASGRKTRVRIDAHGGGFGDGRTGRLAVEGEAISFGSAIDPIPFALTLEAHREGGFRRVDSHLKGRLGGERSFADFTLDVTRENGVVEFGGAGDLDFRRLNAFLGPSGSRLIAGGRGTFEFALAANASGESLLEGRVGVMDLEAPGSDLGIDRVVAPFRVRLAPTSSWSLSAPVEVWRVGLKSDLLIEITGVVDDPRWHLDGSLSGERIRVEDLGILGLLFMMPTDPSLQEPVWGGLRGRIGLDFRRVHGPNGLVVESLTAGIEFGEDDVGFLDVNMKVGDGSLRGGATLGFEPEADESYGFDGAWKGRGIHLGRAFSTRTIDGPLDLDLNLNAHAKDFRRLGERMSGLLSLHGGPGVYRGLKGHARTASSVADFFGSLFRSEALQTVAALSDELAEIPYDSMDLEAVRTAGKGFDVRRILLTGPTVKLYGKGSLADSPLADLMSSPMHFEFSLGAKGSLAELFSALGLVPGNQPDWEGYLFIPKPFNVRGTPEDPDFSELWGMLRKAAFDSIR